MLTPPVQSNATAQIQNSGVPTASSVLISGTSTEGQILTGSYAYADPNSFAEGSSTFHWLEATSSTGTYAGITGATAKTYTLLSSDVGKYLEFRVIPVASVPPTTGTSTYSNPTSVSAPDSYPAASSVSISGSPTVGQLLTGSYAYSDAGNHAELGSVYAWLEASNASGTYNPISGATSLTYTLQSSDAGNYLEFEVTPQSTVATGSSTVSAFFGPIGAASSSPSLPAIASFTASPSSITAGQSSLLSWSVSNASSVTLSNGLGDVSNETSYTVAPSATTGYTLTATNPNGTTTANLTVTVTAPVASSGGGGGGGGTFLCARRINACSPCFGRRNVRNVTCPTRAAFDISHR